MRVFDTLKSQYQCRFVPVANNTHKIWTIYSNVASKNVPLVLLHGFGGGIGLWALNLDQLSADRPVYAFDLPGFARSSRPTFSQDPLEAEQQFVNLIEEWRIQIGLNEPFILLGHSFGGFLSAAYAIRYPTYVKQLVLVDPWGFAEKPEDVWQSERLQRVPPWLRSISAVVMKFAPLAGLRAAGPLGKEKIRMFSLCFVIALLLLRYLRDETRPSRFASEVREIVRRRQNIGVSLPLQCSNTDGRRRFSDHQ